MFFTWLDGLAFEMKETTSLPGLPALSVFPSSFTFGQPCSAALSSASFFSVCSLARSSSCFSHRRDSLVRWGRQTSPHIIDRHPWARSSHPNQAHTAIAPSPSALYPGSTITERETFGNNARMPCAGRSCKRTTATSRRRRRTTSCSRSPRPPPISASSLHRATCALDFVALRGCSAQLQRLVPLVYRVPRHFVAHGSLRGV